MKELHYYDARREKVQAPKPEPINAKATATRWLRGETEQQYEKRMKDAGTEITPHRLYIEKGAVRRETIDALDAHGKEAFRSLYRSQSPEVQKFMRQGNGVKTLDSMPHLGYVEIAAMAVHYPDGSRSIIKIVGSNFEAKIVPGEDGLQFKAIPPQVDGVRNKQTFFAYGRKINPDGSTGELDPVFSKGGIAYQPKDFREVAEAVKRIGEMNIYSQKRFQFQKLKQTPRYDIEATLEVERGIANAQPLSRASQARERERRFINAPSLAPGF